MTVDKILSIVPRLRSLKAGPAIRKMIHDGRCAVRPGKLFNGTGVHTKRIALLTGQVLKSVVLGEFCSNIDHDIFVHDVIER